MSKSQLIYSNKYKLLTIYKISVVILFLTSLHPIWFWGVPGIVISILCVIISASFLITNREQGKFITKQQLLSITLLFVILLYISKRLNIFGFINTFLFFFNFYTILSLRRELKINILNFVVKCYAFIILVSLCFYLLNYVVGISLPSSIVRYSDIEQYTYNNYRFFITIDRLEFMILPRFQSIFIEPGHLGMIASFFLYVFSYNIKKWYIIVLLIGSLLTFSLTAYVLIIIGIVLKIVTRVRTIIIGSILLLLLGLLVYRVAITYNGGNNLLNTMIVMRLVIKDGELAGNNRTQEGFDQEFSQSIRNPINLFFGKELDINRFPWGNAGIKLFIYTYGIIGLILVIFLYLSFTKSYPWSVSYPLFILYSASFLQRAYPLWSSWLIIFICGLAVLDNLSYHKKQ